MHLKAYQLWNIQLPLTAGIKGVWVRGGGELQNIFTLGFVASTASSDYHYISGVQQYPKYHELATWTTSEALQKL